AAILKEKYSDDHESGIQLITVEDAYQLCTKAYVAEYVKKALELRKTPPLSKASLEVLAIIAYNQPVTRSFIEMVRGVDSSAIVASLTEKGLVTEKGTLDAPGRPILFGTTDAFLRCFGLESIDQLPKTDLAMAGEQVTIDFSEESEKSEPAENIE
ncbi:MAG: SMC-Scp complex subunit ScpB, partial [Clostridia bacterium]|nr:SMC-Scp complex subunit ScpB [Clostridia bacterium]